MASPFVFQIERNELITLTVTITASDGTAQDLTGCGVTFTARYKITDIDANAVFIKNTSSGVSIPDPATGVATVTIEPSDTGKLSDMLMLLTADIKVTDSLNNLVSTLRGVLIMSPNVPMDDIEGKIRGVSPDGVTDDMRTEIPKIYKAVVAHFQSPYGRKGKGGTGRKFEPITETRYFDGTGYPELRVEDIVPNTPIDCRAYDVHLVDIDVKQNLHGLGYNVLYRPQSAGAILGTSYGLSGLFPIGKQNIKVTATWGYASTWPDDVWDSICEEVAYRTLVQFTVDMSGVGEKLKMGQFEVDTAVGEPAWKMSSPLAVYHVHYLDAIQQYRDSQTWKMARIANRMS